MKMDTDQLASGQPITCEMSDSVLVINGIELLDITGAPHLLFETHLTWTRRSSRRKNKLLGGLQEVEQLLAHDFRLFFLRPVAGAID